MTVVVAATDGRTIYAGCDTAWSHDNDIIQLREEKLFQCGSYLVGFTGRALIRQILRHHVELPEPPSEPAELDSFLVHQVLPVIRRAVLDQGAAGEGRGFLGESTMILLGCHGQIFFISPELNLARPMRDMPFGAIGAGRHYSYGALQALFYAGISPSKRMVELALESTQVFSARVRGPFCYLTHASTL